MLRRKTAASHDRLDHAMALLDLGDPADYATFLHLQLAARAPIERWAAIHCEAGLRPPESAPLLRADLAQLGECARLPESRFEPPHGAHSLGVAWAIAGSHLGNRVLLSRLERRIVDLPTAFLADPRLPIFWKQLRPQLDVAVSEAPAAGAVAAAEAVFACFTVALDACEGWRAA